MAKIDFKGIDEYSKRLEILFKDTEKVVRQAVHEGAAVVADEIKAGLKSLPVEEGDNGLPPVGMSRQKPEWMAMEAYRRQNIRTEFLTLC